MLDNELYQSLLRDLDKALSLSENGQDNKSRVVARMVAGKAIRELYIQLNFSSSLSLNPYQYLILAKNQVDIFTQILEDLEALTAKVNQDYSFPENLDLISAAKNIIIFAEKY